MVQETITPTGIKTVGRIAPVGLQNLGTYRHNPDRYYNCGKNSTGRVTCSNHTLDMFVYVVGRLCAVCYVVNHRTGSTFCHCSIPACAGDVYGRENKICTNLTGQYVPTQDKNFTAIYILPPKQQQKKIQFTNPTKIECSLHK